MRILFATTHPTVVGGVETYLRHLLPALVSRGHEVALLHETAADPDRAAVNPGVSGLVHWHLADPTALREAAAWRPDVCYAQGLADPAFEIALLERFPVVLFAHNYHGTCISGTKHRAFPIARPCDRPLGAACLLAYLPCRCGGLNPATMLRLYALQQRRLRLLPRYRAVLVASTHMRDEYRRHGVAEDRLHLLPLFPTGQQVDAAGPVRRPLTGRVLLVARLTDLKGGVLLVEALWRVQTMLGQRLSLVVAGDGPERDQIEKAGRQAGVSVSLEGWVSPERREELMRSADVLAVPGTWPEPFGLVGIEAGCVGLPAVGFAVGGIPDWLVPGETGELAPGDAPTAAGLADALVRILRDPEYRHRLGQGAWRLARTLTPARHLDSLEQILTGVVARQPQAIGGFGVTTWKPEGGRRDQEHS